MLKKNGVGLAPLSFIIDLFTVDKTDLSNALLPTLCIVVNNIVGGICLSQNYHQIQFAIISI